MQTLRTEQPRCRAVRKYFSTQGGKLVVYGDRSARVFPPFSHQISFPISRTEAAKALWDGRAKGGVHRYLESW